MAGKVVVSTLNDDTGVLATQNGMTGIPKAWAQFTAVGASVTINSSFNISSITRTSAGNFYADFTNAMPNANYGVTGSTSIDISSGTFLDFINSGSSSSPFYIVPTSSRFYFATVAISSGSSFDPRYCSFAILSS
jgi:hypothetical protein